MGTRLEEIAKEANEEEFHLSSSSDSLSELEVGPGAEQIAALQNKKDMLW